MPNVFVPKETVADETRVAAIPDTVKRLVKAGFEVRVESGAGLGAAIANESYVQAGATLVEGAQTEYGAADVVVKLNPPTLAEARMLKPGSVLISFLWPLSNKDVVRALMESKISAFALDQLPRITRAQKMDALTSQASIAGYKAVLIAAAASPRIFPMMMTPAGTLTPAKMVVMGAGVAGLQAIATGRRLGAVIEVSDIRPAVKEQVESLGAKFIEVPTDKAFEDKGGYAKEVTPEFLKRQQEIVAQRIAVADVVITTAQVPGKPAPKLVTEAMVRSMKPGSVIVDMAVESGGNCELSEFNQTVVKHGVTLIGKANLAGSVPYHASEQYAKNVLNVVEHLWVKGELKLDFTDEITNGSFVTHNGGVRLKHVADALGVLLAEDRQPEPASSTAPATPAAPAQ